MSKIIQNAVYIPEDDVYLVSSHVHDYKTHHFKDGNEYSVDGGDEYIRRGATSFEKLESRVVNYCLSNKSSVKDIREKFLWGGRGKDGKQPLKYCPVRLLETDHLEAIIATQDQIKGKIAEKVILYWLNKRKESVKNEKR